MTSIVLPWLRGARDGWERFFFEPTSTVPLALVRIATGLVLLGWAGSVVRDLPTFFTSDGLLPDQPDAKWVIGLLGVSDSPLVVGMLFGLLVASAVALIAGFHTRLVAVVAYFAYLSFDRRMPFVGNSGDLLLRLVLGVLCLAPAGAALSYDRWSKNRAQFWESPMRSPWALRLLQIQVSMLYLSTVWAKVKGTMWNDGTAVSYALRLEDLTRFRPPSLFVDNELVVNALTWATLAVEFSLAVLIWNQRARPLVLAAGVAFHTGIALTLLVGLFSVVVFGAYLAFVDPAATEGRVRSIRDWWSSGSRVRRSESPSEGETKRKNRTA